MLFLLLLSLPFPFRRRFSLQFPFAVFDFAGDRPMIKWLFSLKHVCPHYLPPPTPTLFNNKKPNEHCKQKDFVGRSSPFYMFSRKVEFNSNSIEIGSRKIIFFMMCFCPILDCHFCLPPTGQYPASFDSSGA